MHACDEKKKGVCVCVWGGEEIKRRKKRSSESDWFHKYI